MNYHELHAKKYEEIKTKYEKEIKAIGEKDGVDMGVATDRLLAIGRANLENKPALYDVGYEFNLVELIRDWAELRYYSNKCL